MQKPKKWAGPDNRIKHPIYKSLNMMCEQNFLQKILPL